MTEYAVVFNAIPEESEAADIGPGWIDGHDPNVRDENPSDLTWFDDQEQAETVIGKNGYSEDKYRTLKREDGEIEVIN